MEHSQDRIERLIQMKSQGHISQAEFDQMKANALEGQQGSQSNSTRLVSEETDLGLYPGLELGTAKENYRLIKQIGEGGMGQLWQVEDLNSSQLLKETCYKAIKVLPIDLARSDVHLNLLHKEATLTAELSHPNIINAYGMREGDQNIPFILMDFLQGQDMEHLIAKKGTMTWKETEPFLEQIAEALDYAWQEHQLIHRDLKPGNLFITEAGRLKVLDFGLAWRIRKSQLSLSKQDVDDQSSQGTVSYMPPEAFANISPDPKQDVYALACVCYQMLTGETPYPPEAARHRNPGLFPEPPAELNNNAWGVLKQGLAYDKQLRTENAGLLVKQLKKAQAFSHSTKTLSSKGKDKNEKTLKKPILIGVCSVAAIGLGVLLNREYSSVQYLTSSSDNYNIEKSSASNKVQALVEKADNLYFKKSNNTEAFKLYQQAAEQGDTVGQNYLAWMYEKGKGVKQSNVKAIEWYRKAAEQGYSQAQSNLAIMYQKGKGVSQSDTKAVEWYRKAAKQGNKDAQRLLGLSYRDGKGVTQSDTKAVDWFRKAAKQGDKEAQYYLATHYQDGKGVLQSPSKALEWFNKSAKQGYKYSQKQLGWIYRDGKGVTQSDTKAVDWFHKAAKQGDKYSQKQLGWMYRDGKGVAQSDKKAVDWFRKAAKQGDKEAQYYLATHYQDGKGVLQSHTKALEWFNKSAEQGYKYSQNYLGWMYRNGKGVTQNDTKAVEWYRMAAKQGVKEAQVALKSLGKKY